MVKVNFGEMSVSDDEYVSDVDSETESKDLESFDVVDFANSKCKVKKENVREKIKLEFFLYWFKERKENWQLRHIRGQ